LRTHDFAVFHIFRTHFYGIRQRVEPEKDKKRDNLSTLNISAWKNWLLRPHGIHKLCSGHPPMSHGVSV